MAKTVADEFAPAWVRDLPSLTTTDAAWLAGVTEETLERVIQTGRVACAADQTGRKRIGLADLSRAVFAQFGQKDSQVAMLRMQLASALKREKELLELLHDRLFSDLPGTAAAEPEPPEAAPPVKGRKIKKK